MTRSSMTASRSSLAAQLDVIEVKPGVKFSKAVLKDLLPDVKTALFFGKVYELDAQELGMLLHTVLGTELSAALFNEGEAHSSDLQDYVVEMLDFVPEYDEGDITFDPDVPKGEILPELWADLEVQVADSIKAVAEKLESVVHRMPGKQGSMMFQSMMVMNAKRPTIGDYRARIHHAPQKQNLVILDVSGSMSSNTIHTIVDDVVAMSYMANAWLAIVSNSTTVWEPGTYSSDDVLAVAEFGGTHYETLSPLFSEGQDWGVVVTVADYDSSQSAMSTLSQVGTATIDEVLDISLVDQPTFLSRCVGQFAGSVRPLVIAAQGRSLCSSW